MCKPTSEPTGAAGSKCQTQGAGARQQIKLIREQLQKPAWEPAGAKNETWEWLKIKTKTKKQKGTANVPCYHRQKFNLLKHKDF